MNEIRKKEGRMLPQEFLNRMEKMLGEDYPLFLASYEREAYKGLRRNPLKAEQEEFENRMPFSLKEVSWAPTGYYYSLTEHPGQHPYHQAGLYYIQEPSAMAAAEYLQVKPGERVLDLCAAPGGKSTQIGGYLCGEGLLVCNEPHSARAKILSENIERMGITNALVTNEMPGKLAEIFPRYFDKILVDAPCSGEGMFLKNEEACLEWSPNNVQLCAKRQDEILEEAAKMLRPGGCLVYSTCTFSEEEDEGSINRFLTGHPEFAFVEEKRFWPHQVEGEGHYIALLKKQGNPEQGDHPSSTNGYARAADLKECPEFVRFQQEYLNLSSMPLWRKASEASLSENWRLYFFGEQLYHLPADMPSLKGLKVLRAGLHLGTVKKNRFEPSHALALALKPSQAKYTISLSSEGKEVRDYLSGQTFLAEGEKGWYLIAVDGYSLGWGKLAGGIMKNHYPKGLRR